VVVDRGRIQGILTDRDIVVRGLAEGKNLENARVNELMTKSIRSVREDASVSEALELMSNAEIRRVPVVNSNDQLVGIVSLGDIAQTNQDGRVGQAVENISEAPPNN